MSRDNCSPARSFNDLWTVTETIYEIAQHKCLLIVYKSLNTTLSNAVIPAWFSFREYRMYTYIHTSPLFKNTENLQ